MKDEKMNKAIKVILYVSKNILKILLYVMIVMAVISVCKSAFSFGYGVFHQEPVAEEYGMDIVVEIPVDSSTMEIGMILEDAGLIEDGKLFIIQEFLSGYHGKINPGEYTLNTLQTPDEMIEIMACSIENSDTEESE